MNEHIPARRRSRFIAEAIEEQLALAEQVDVLDEAAGAWSDANHPEMATEEDIDRWLAELRSSWRQPEAPDRG
ncbi:MAG: hypothetical protein WHX53_02590 [Anaerolineae bacterium]